MSFSDTNCDIRENLNVSVFFSSTVCRVSGWSTDSIYKNFLGLIRLFSKGLRSTHALNVWNCIIDLFYI